MGGNCLPQSYCEVIKLEHVHSFTMHSFHLLALKTGRLVYVSLLKCECGRETINPSNLGFRALRFGTEDTRDFLSEHGITKSSLKEVEAIQTLEMRKSVP